MIGQNQLRLCLSEAHHLLTLALNEHRLKDPVRVTKVELGDYEVVLTIQGEEETKPDKAPRI